MQYLTDAEGKRVGVFLSMSEWEEVRDVLSLSDVDQEENYDVWFREKVEDGLRDAAQGKLIPLAQTAAKLKARGFNVD